jgi:hypothetical protein
VKDAGATVIHNGNHVLFAFPSTTKKKQARHPYASMSLIRIFEPPQLRRIVHCISNCYVAGSGSIP